MTANGMEIHNGILDIINTSTSKTAPWEEYFSEAPKTSYHFQEGLLTYGATNAARKQLMRHQVSETLSDLLVKSVHNHQEAATGGREGEEGETPERPMVVVPGTTFFCQCQHKSYVESIT